MEKLATWLVRSLLSLRYDIKIEGLKDLKNKGGILFLANHPALIDPVILLSHLERFHPHPVVMESLFFTPYLRKLLQWIGAIAVPTFDENANSYKKKAIQRSFDTIISGLKRGENYLIYPAGGLKMEASEQIGGASGVHTLISRYPQARVVLINTVGLWGSSFSKAQEGKTPHLGRGFKRGMSILLKNGIVFTPRRKVYIEVKEVTDFPYQGTRRDINQYLENWYNRNIEPLNLVRESLFSTKLPSIALEEKEVQQRMRDPQKEGQVRPVIFNKLATLSGLGQDSINDKMHLSHDLGLDSLDFSELTLFLKEEFNVAGVVSTDISEVGDLIAFAAKLKKPKSTSSNGQFKRKKERGRASPVSPQGRTIQEAFLRSVQRMGSNLATMDPSGCLNYRKLLLRTLLLSRTFRRQKSRYVGVMLPSTNASNIAILALAFAKKVPVMINWTMGSATLKTILQETGITETITANNFVNQLNHTDFGDLDETFVFLENIALDLTVVEKIRAWISSFLPAFLLLKLWGIKKINPEDPFVLLYTSGTEGRPKGVPLSHRNLLSNVTDGYSLISFNKEDFLISALPPFHSFGFSVTGLFPLITGISVGYLPNPVDGKRMATSIEAWQATILCSAPTFLKNLVRLAEPRQFKSVRLIISGAEKLTDDLEASLQACNSNTQIIEGYGITECAPILTLTRPNMRRGVGQPLPSVELLIVNPETYEPRLMGQEGLIMARGPNIFSGYFNKELPSPFVEIEGISWYKTGDMGYLDENGILTLTGRYKRFIKVGGEMISLGAIEMTLNGALPGGQDQVLVAVVGKEEEPRPQIVLFTTCSLTLEEANALLKSGGHSNVARLTSVRHLKAIPLLGTGKINYQELMQQL